jgi:hypothetical protein
MLTPITETETVLLATEDEVAEPHECDFEIEPPTWESEGAGCRAPAWYYHTTSAMWFCADHAALFTGDDVWPENDDYDDLRRIR